MASAFSIILPQKLVVKLRAKAEETDLLPDELALLFKSLNEELDHEELVVHYRALSEKYLAVVKELLSKGDLVQASEKLWGAAALAVKRIAAKRGTKLEQHGSLWLFVDGLSIESGGEDFFNFFGKANALHRNYYENEMTHKAIERGYGTRY